MGEILVLILLYLPFALLLLVANKNQTLKLERARKRLFELRVEQALRRRRWR